MWKSFFRDSIKALDQLSKFINENQREYVLKNNVNIKLKDMECLFDYYLEATQNFAKRKGEMFN